MIGIWVWLIWTSFLIPQGTLPWQPVKVKKSAFFRTTLLCCAAIPKRIIISQFRFQKNEFLYIVYNFGDIWSRNPWVYAVSNSTFFANTAKIGISRQISQNILNLSWLLYRFGRRIGWDDYPTVCLAVAQGTLLWQPVKFRGWSQTLPGTTLLLALAWTSV